MTTRDRELVTLVDPAPFLSGLEPTTSTVIPLTLSSLSSACPQGYRFKDVLDRRRVVVVTSHALLK